MISPIEMKLSVFIDDRQWDLYGVEFDTADGKFETYIYALSYEHAVACCAELRETARISGQIVHVEGAA